MALTERLDILINATGNKAIAEFGKVGKAASSEMGKAEKASDGLTGALGKAGNQAKAGLAAGLAVGGAALVSFANQAVDAASDLGEQQSATNVIFKDGAKIVRDFGEAAAESIGLSERAALQAANGFGGLFQNVGFSQKGAATLSIGLVQLAGDLASFYNVSGGAEEVLAKLKSGLAGEAEPLKSLNILINETAVKSKAMEMGLGGANRELSEGEKQAARLQLILEQTSDAQGDLERTSDSLANKQRKLNAQYEDTKAKLGETLIPIYAAVVGELSELASATEENDKVQRLGAFAYEKNAGTLEKFGQVLFGIRKEEEEAGASAKKLADIQRVLGAESKHLATETMTLAQAQDIAAKAAEEHAKQIDKQNDAMRSALGAGLSYERSLNSVEDASISVIEAKQKLGAAIKEFGKNSVEARVAAEELSRAQLGLRGDVLSASESFVRQAELQAIATGKEWNAVEAARAQIAGLNDMKKKYPELRAEIDLYIAKLLSIPGVIDTRVSMDSGRLSPADKSGRRPHLTANGGIFSGAQWRVIGEDGPEAVIPLSSSRSGRARALMAQAGLTGGVGGGSQMNVSIYMPPGSDGDDVVAAIRRYEERNGKAWRSA